MRDSQSLPLFYEATFEVYLEVADPVRELDLRVVFTSPSGRRLVRYPFWDGGRVWRVRFTDDEAGEWSFEVTGPPEVIAAVEGGTGKFRLLPYAGENPLYRHGRLQVSGDKSYLVHADGTPFFWLADTAWNAALKADPADWREYLALRREQGFTAVQTVMTHWRACPADNHGGQAFTGTERVRINPAFFRRIDEKVADISRHGLVPALVILWALTQRDPGWYLPEEDAILVARYIVARYDAFRPVWFLGGDGRYGQQIRTRRRTSAGGGEDPDRWRRIGRAVFGELGKPPERGLVTMHPCGVNWVGDLFRKEPWYDFIGYQSGHSEPARSIAWILKGEPSERWQGESRLPVINLEPCYEDHCARPTTRRFTPEEVRQALYGSLLSAPTAGVTYGHVTLWFWSEYWEEPMGHAGIGLGPPWREALRTVGASAVTHLRRFFGSLPWWELRPAPDFLAEQPGMDDVTRFVSASMTKDRRYAVMYLPRGGEIRINPSRLRGEPRVRWFDPRRGVWSDDGRARLDEGVLWAPSEEDWAVWIGPASSPTPLP